MLGAGIFNSGILATGTRDDARYNYVPAPPEVRERVGRLQQVCERHGVEMAHAAVQFVAAQPAISSMIFGACSPAELDQALAGTRAVPPAALWAELRTAGLLDPAAPVPGASAESSLVAFRLLSSERCSGTKGAENVFHHQHQMQFVRRRRLELWDQVPVEVAGLRGLGVYQ